MWPSRRCHLTNSSKDFVVVDRCFAVYALTPIASGICVRHYEQSFVVVVFRLEEDFLVLVDYPPFSALMNEYETTSSERNGANDADFHVWSVDDVLQFQLPKHYRTGTNSLDLASISKNDPNFILVSEIVLVVGDVL